MVLDEQAQQAILRHMNEDHPDDCVVIVRGLGGRRDVTSAVMTRVSDTAATFTATVPDGPTVAVVLPWSAPITARPQVRAEVVDMYERACAALGLPPRAEH